MVILSLNGTFWMSISPVSWDLHPQVGTQCFSEWGCFTLKKTARIQGGSGSQFYYERPRPQQGKGDTRLMGFFCNKKTIRCIVQCLRIFATNAAKYPYCGRGGHPCTSARHPAAVHIRILNERSLGFWKTPEAIWSGKSTCSRLS